jgi:hypothetical protein
MADIVLDASALPAAGPGYSIQAATFYQTMPAACPFAAVDTHCTVEDGVADHYHHRIR